MSIHWILHQRPPPECRKCNAKSAAHHLTGSKIFMSHKATYKFSYCTKKSAIWRASPTIFGGHPFPPPYFKCEKLFHFINSKPSFLDRPILDVEGYSTSENGTVSWPVFMTCKELPHWCESWSTKPLQQQTQQGQSPTKLEALAARWYMGLFPRWPVRR